MLLNKISQHEANTHTSNLYEVSKIVELTEAKNK